MSKIVLSVPIYGIKIFASPHSREYNWGQNTDGEVITSISRQALEGRLRNLSITTARRQEVDTLEVLELEGTLTYELD